MSDWDPPLVPDLWVSDHRPYDTGLLDAQGERILRHPLPIGFYVPPARGHSKAGAAGNNPKEK